MAKILIIDDEDIFREDFATLLKRSGHDCATAPDAAGGLKKIGEFSPEVVFLDIVMPDRTGIEILDEIVSGNPQCSVIIMTAFGNLETAVDAFRKGAVDYILKPVVDAEVLQKLKRIEIHANLSQEVRLLRRILTKEEKAGFVGQSEPIEAVVKMIEQVAPTASSVLITGESGTGKELVAREIHKRSDSSSEPFVAINCSCIPESLLESELFGHVKGAFTGAEQKRQGYFELAGKGTILLDEIGDMPIVLQSKLLRILEQKEFLRVGEGKPLPFHARVLSSTNKDIKNLVEEGGFRKDLYYRLNVVEINVPPLRDRFNDVLLLSEHFINEFNHELGCGCLGLDRNVVQAFLDYDWPGNVRQLRNIIERALILHQEPYIQMSHLPEEFNRELQPNPISGVSLKDAVGQFEVRFIEQVIRDHGGNKEAAAKSLNVNPSTLYRKLQQTEVK